MRFSVNVPRRYGKDETFYIVSKKGAVWNRKRQVWDEGLNTDSNPAYVKLGFAKMGAAAASKQVTGPVSIWALSLLEKHFETLPEPDLEF